jgi:hypothetical protein
MKLLHSKSRILMPLTAYYSNLRSYIKYNCSSRLEFRQLEFIRTMRMTSNDALILLVAAVRSTYILHILTRQSSVDTEYNDNYNLGYY